jgi:uncharacterized YccA/Bax inhibitor family protein
MRTANPALNEKTFEGLRAEGEVMTVNGTVHRTAVLTLLLILSASYTWKIFYGENGPAQVMPWMIGGLLGGLVIGLVTAFAKTWARFTAPIYAAAEGFFLGGLSAIMEARFSGIVIQAVALTFGTLLCLLFAYRTGLIRATENFKLGVAAATGAVCLFYLTTFVLGMFGINIPYIHESGLIGIGFSLVVVTIAALNLVLDFDFIENATAAGVPKYMEWYAAFGLLVTLIWLYIEILRLLSKLKDR